MISKFKRVISNEDVMLLQCIQGLIVFMEFKNDFIYTIGNVPIGRMEVNWSVNNTYYHYLN
jgi:hypothetical protein